MGTWKTVFDSDVIGRPVKIEIHQDGGDAGASLEVRVTTTASNADIPHVVPPIAAGSEGTAPIPAVFAGGAAVIEADDLDELVEDLEAAGFTEAQIDEIVGFLPRKD